MKTPWRTLIVVPLLVAGCAVKASPPQPVAVVTQPAEPPTFTGEVWTWDEQTNVVTLRQDTGTIRVQVTPDEMKGLRMHQTATLRGQLAPPADLVIMQGTATLVPRGPVDEQQVEGKVTAVDPAGTMNVDTTRGPITVWTPMPGTSAFKVGDDVKVRIRAQALEPVVAPTTSTPPGETTTTEPAASVMSEPGEYAVVKGPITASSPTGQITVQSPRGPVRVWVPDASRYRPGQYAEVRTVVQPAR